MDKEDNGIYVKVDSCWDCPHHAQWQVSHWLLGHQKAWRLQCKLNGRDIIPADRPLPPKWCPLREEN